MAGTLRVSEIFLSIQGESARAGLPCVLVRLAGCNLRCAWCDTLYAQDLSAGKEWSVEEVLARVEAMGCRRVELTGGEPLLQPAAGELLRRLCDQGCETLLETNGSIDLSGIDPRVVRIVDVKCPSSGQSEATRWENLDLLRPRDEVKFVIADRTDYEYARRLVRQHDLTRRCAVILSPVFGAPASRAPACGSPASDVPASAGMKTPPLDPALLARWILEDELDVRLGLQLHRIIWPGRDRGV